MAWLDFRYLFETALTVIPAGVRTHTHTHDARVKGFISLEN